MALVTLLCCKLKWGEGIAISLVWMSGVGPSMLTMSMIRLQDQSKLSFVYGIMACPFSTINKSFMHSWLSRLHMVFAHWQLFHSPLHSATAVT